MPDIVRRNNFLNTSEALTDALATSGTYSPTYFSYLGWTFDPHTTAGAGAPTAGAVYYSRVPIAASGTISNVLIDMVVASTAENANCFAAVFNAAGTRLGLSADISVSLRTTGLKTVPVVLDGGQSLAVTRGDFVYVAQLVGTAGATPSQPRRSTSAFNTTAPNQGAAAALYRAAQAGAGLSAIPTTVTVASWTSSSNFYWAGVS
jgi:hypothetical protein